MYCIYGWDESSAGGMHNGRCTNIELICDMHEDEHMSLGGRSIGSRGSPSKKLEIVLDLDLWLIIRTCPLYIGDIYIPLVV